MQFDVPSPGEIPPDEDDVLEVDLAVLVDVGDRFVDRDVPAAGKIPRQQRYVGKIDFAVAVHVAGRGDRHRDGDRARFKGIVIMERQLNKEYAV